MLRSTLLSLAAAGMALAPVAASAASANPAASLSVAHAPRAGTPAGKQNDLFGGGSAGIYAVFIIVALVVIGVIAVSNEPDSP